MYTETDKSILRRLELYWDAVHDGWGCAMPCILEVTADGSGDAIYIPSRCFECSCGQNKMDTVTLLQTLQETGGRSGAGVIRQGKRIFPFTGKREPGDIYFLADGSPIFTNGIEKPWTTYTMFSWKEMDLLRVELEECCGIERIVITRDICTVYFRCGRLPGRAIIPLELSEKPLDPEVFEEHCDADGNYTKFPWRFPCEDMEAGDL